MRSRLAFGLTISLAVKVRMLAPNVTAAAPGHFRSWGVDRLQH